MPNPIVDEAMKHRKADRPIDPIFVGRWSPRAMSGEPLTEDELLTVFEAARWAPSSYNEQPWRFIYAKRGTPAWQGFFDALMPSNQAWCAKAAVLVVLVSKTNFTQGGKPNTVHTFDTGSAWMALALQAAKMGLVAHGMAGFDRAKAGAAISLPDGFVVEAMCALGRPGRKEDLPEGARKMEFPSGRKPVKEFLFEGRIPG